MKLKKMGKVIKLNSGEYVRVDSEDYEELNKYKWYLYKSQKWCYAIRQEYKKGSQKTIFMHRSIMGMTKSDIYVDHKDHDGLNNRRYNLRISNNRYNQYNVNKKVSSKQKYKNIRELKGDRWQVRIRTPIGRIEKIAYSEREAVKLYNELVIKYHGEFAFIQEFKS